MATVTFDALKFVETLESNGIERKQAEAFAKAVRDSQKDALTDFVKTAQEASVHATSELDSKTEKALIKLDGKVENLVLGLRKDMENLDQRMTARFTLLQWMLGALITGMLGLLIRAFAG